MNLASENPKAVFWKLPRKNLANFRIDTRREGESIAEFVARSVLTPEQITCVESQPVRGTPNLRRLRGELQDAGFADIRLDLRAGGESLTFKVRLTPQVMADDSDSLLRLWIGLFRAAGFRVGFSEIAITAVDGPQISGGTLTGPIDEVAEHGAPAIELEHG